MAGDAKPFTTEEWWSDYESCRSDKPTREDPNGPAMLTALAALFGAHAIDDTVKMEYDTEVYYGLLD